MNPAPSRAHDTVYSCSTVVAQNLAPFDYFLVEKSLAAFAIFWGQCQDTPLALQMLSVQVPPHPHPSAVEQLPEPSIQICCTSCLFHGSSRLRPPILVGSIREASSASAKTPPYAAAPFWWLCPLPGQVRHLRWGCPALSLHHPYLTDHCHCRNLRYRSDCLRSQPSSGETFFLALWSSIPLFQLPLYLPATAKSLPQSLQLAFLPQWSLSQHNAQSISLSLHCKRSQFHVVSQPQGSFWIASYAMTHGLGLLLLSSHSCLHSLDDVIGWTALSICNICPPGVAKSSFWKHWQL